MDLEQIAWDSFILNGNIEAYLLHLDLDAFEKMGYIYGKDEGDSDKTS